MIFIHTNSLALQILALKCPSDEDVQSYVKFISLFMHEFARVSRRVEDLHRVAQQLYPVYMQPVKDGKVDTDNATALYAAFAPRFKDAVANFTSGAASASLAVQKQRIRYAPAVAGRSDVSDLTG